MRILNGLGDAQQLLGAQLLLRSGGGTGKVRKKPGGVKRFKKKAVRVAAKKRRSGKPAKLKKGSAAAKAFMSRLRAMRRK